MICYIFGYFGARALNIFIDGEPFDGFAGWLSLLLSPGGLVFYGGFLLALIVASAFAGLRKWPVRDLLDIGVPSVFVGLAIGRIGCFLNGDDFGTVTSRFWGVVFPNLQDNLPRHPSQLFESAAALILLGVLFALLPLARRKLFSGALGLIGIASYAVLRFFLEFLRGDERGWVIEGMLSTSQFIALVVFLGTGILFFRMWTAKSPGAP